ncbi:MAG: 3-oxoacyl-[acyl-carrier protein] reductase [Verrucomicrobiota bacterium]
MRKLAGKVALVTGGSRGIGAAIAKRLAADGAAVALTYSASPGKADEVVRSIEAPGGKALAIKADATDTEAVRLAVAKTIGAFGGIDILVNNAGTGIFAPIEQFSLEDFEKLIAINVRGLFVATQEAARHMREGGRIIHIGSTNSERMPFVGGSVYALTKGAVAGFTKGLARDLGPRGITVNNVQPGPIDTDMNPPTATSPGRLFPSQPFSVMAMQTRSPASLRISPAPKPATLPVRACWPMEVSPPEVGNPKTQAINNLATFHLNA